jgi:hypothetical protein
MTNCKCSGKCLSDRHPFKFSFVYKYSIIIPDIKQQRIERPLSRVIHGNDRTIFLLSVINGSASS